MTQRRTALFTGLTAGLVLALIFIFGFLTGNAVGRHEASVSDGTNDPNLRDFLTAYHLVTQESYFRPFNRHQLVYAAIDGMLSATGDPHTIFLSPPENRTASKQLNGSQYAGIGAIVQPNGTQLQVVALVPHAPAAVAGMKVGDIITRVNGRSVRSLAGDAAVSAIHGTAGTLVKLTVLRGKHALVISIKRGKIPAVTAYGTALPHHLALLRIESFGEGTPAEVASALHGFARSHVKGIVIDLRQNPGGFVDAAQQIVSDFLSRGVVAYEHASHGTTTPLKVLPGRRILNVPLAVLVDGDTASAAEITAAALRDEAHAVLLGSKTYGKGSMQSVYALPDGSTVRITDRLWLTPRHASINNKGLQPSIQVPPDVGAFTGNDPAVNAAVSNLLRRTAG